jgi:aspartate kinase
MMNSEKGFARRVLTILEHHGMSFEHMPTGIDTLSIVINCEEMKGREDAVLSEIKKTVSPDIVRIDGGLALIAVVGLGMSNRVGTAAQIFTTLAEKNINIRLIDQGSSELNVILGVEEKDYENAIKSIYQTFFG